MTNLCCVVTAARFCRRSQAYVKALSGAAAFVESGHPKILGAREACRVVYRSGGHYHSRAACSEACRRASTGHGPVNGYQRRLSPRVCQDQLPVSPVTSTSSKVILTAVSLKAY